MNDGGAAAAARHQQRVESLCAAAIRALSGEADLHFRGRRLHRGRTPLPLFAPHLHPSLMHDDFASFRGAADGLALRLSQSNAASHAQARPEGTIERLVFEMLEQFRVEAQVPDGMPGVARNLRHRFEQWSIAFHRSRLTDSARGILLYTVAQVCRARVTGEPVLDATEDLMESTRGALAPLIGIQLAGLRRSRHDQAAYAQHALAIAHTVAQMVKAAALDESTPQNDDADEADEERAVFSLLVDLEADAGETIAQAATGRSRVLDEAQGRYRVFTTAYDREHPVGELVRDAQLKDLRERLDQCVVAEGIAIARLARQLKAVLALPERDGWNDGEEEGRIDGRRLAQIVSSPAERRVFRTERAWPVADGVVAFLIDCSGSMKAHAQAVAVLADVFVRALELAGVASEVLGFTTGAWNGGRARRDWLHAGRPAHPGRLNEVSHLVFKAADTPWRHAKPAIAALLKGDLFREGIDGEAVAWAAARLSQRAESRRLLIVISDGCPMDGATGLANDAHYLDQHLVDVVRQVEEAREVELMAVGVGLDLSPYYSRCIAVDPASESVNDVVSLIVAALARPPRR